MLDKSDVSYSARSRLTHRAGGARPTAPCRAAEPHSRSPVRGSAPSAGQAHSAVPSAPASAETGGAFTRSRKWTDKPKSTEDGQRTDAYSHAKTDVQPVSRQRPERPASSTAAPVRPPGRAVSSQPAHSPAKRAKADPPSTVSGTASTAAVSRSASAVAETAAAGASLSHGDSEKQEDVQDSGARAGNAGKNGASLAAAQAARRMKRQMQKRQAEHAAEKGAAGAVKTVRGVAEKAKALFQLIAKGGGKAALAVAVIALLALFLIAVVASCATLFNGALGGVSSVTFAASDSDIDKAEAYYSAKEADLRAQINDAQQTHPGYNEYDYVVGTIGHSPVALIACLTTLYGDFSFESIKPDLDALFAVEYQLTFTARTETRTRAVTTTDPDTGQATTTQQSYPYTILTVKLNAQDFITMVTNKLNGTNGAVAAFNAYLQSKGNRQYFSNPFAFGWSAYTTLSSDNRASIDVPVGTQVLAALDGTVTTADGGTVVITGSDGLSVEYDGCGTVQVRAGQSITKGAHVALTGSGFSIVFTHNGEHLNPTIFADTGDAADNTAVTIGGQPVGGNVEAYRATVTQLAPQYGMGAYVNLILAVMEQESGGRGGDPMQAAEGPFNTRFPKRPNGITDPLYSIQCGIQELHQNLQLAGCTGPTDMAGIALALQGYNFGSGFISWARGHGGYTLANAQAFAQAEASTLGWSSYGDPYYVPHVLRYYKST
ncbi:MAG: lysozyme family protein [Ethanoligenens sp.]